MAKKDDKDEKPSTEERLDRIEAILATHQLDVHHDAVTDKAKATAAASESNE